MTPQEVNAVLVELDIAHGIVWVDGSIPSRDRLAELLEKAIDAIRAAQAGEAGTAETVKQGSVHEHAVAKPCAQKP